MNLLSYYRPLPLRCTVVVVVTFMIGLGLGYHFAPEFSSEDSFIHIDCVNYRDKPYTHELVSIRDQNKMFLSVASHNALLIALTLSLGSLVFFFPLIRSSVLGCVMGICLWSLGSPLLWWKFLLPHSLIELPVIAYVNAVGMKSGLRFVMGSPQGRSVILKHELKANMKLFALLLPFIIFAALLEAYVTRRLC